MKLDESFGEWTVSWADVAKHSLNFLHFFLHEQVNEDGIDD